MCWTIKEDRFSKDSIETNGNRFMTGNGYMGFRGTLEEFSKNELVACNLAGLYDKVGDSWRETVNAPNGLFAQLYCDGTLLGVLSSDVHEHYQSLNIRNGLHSRSTVFKAPGNNSITVSSQRFLSFDDLHLICLKYAFSCTRECTIRVVTGIDGDVWDINGPHLENHQMKDEDRIISISAITHELKIPVVVAELLNSDFGGRKTVKTDKSILRVLDVKCSPGTVYQMTKYVSVYTGLDNMEDAYMSAVMACRKAGANGFDECMLLNDVFWNAFWQDSDVAIEGDPEAQFALRYSLYQLKIIAPTHTGRCSIPARGLSGQVYKGAVFWDTEIFMLPFFIFTNPEIAKNLIMYRYHTLDGARRKAAEYGFRGAFYAWESQDTGDDACTLFNITDVFTNRPMRTYFRDKQIHISGDVARAIWQYYSITGDESLLLNGGAEVILECARFFYSYAYFKPEKGRFELLDVTGPDEYHERVNNNAYTNQMARLTLEVALEVIALLRLKYPGLYAHLISRLDYQDEIGNIQRMHDLLYIPEPDGATGLIEQFDGYGKLEEIRLEELKSRIINPNEYLGGGNGIASTTRIIKQADVVLMLNLFKARYAKETIKSNWDFYEPRTEHGSSLSPCVYALVASDLGYVDWAYKYFMKTATIDISGHSKQYVGTLYIGGTHPAANGGAWMAAILGFGGISFNNGEISIRPALPRNWESMRFRVSVRGQRFDIVITKNEVMIAPEPQNTREQSFIVAGTHIACGTGRTVKLKYRGSNP